MGKVEQETRQQAILFRQNELLKPLLRTIQDLVLNNRYDYTVTWLLRNATEKVTELLNSEQKKEEEEWGNNNNNGSTEFCTVGSIRR